MRPPSSQAANEPRCLALVILASVRHTALLMPGDVTDMRQQTSNPVFLAT